MMNLLACARLRRTTIKPRWLAFAVAALAAALSGGAALRASVPVPLPDFELSRLDGARFQSSTGLPNTGKWLILYVQPNCRPCDKLLRLIKQGEHPELSPKMVIIVGGLDHAKVTEMRGKLPDLADAQWFADDSRKAWVSLKMTGVPMVFGMRARTIEWSLSGVLPSDAQVTSILASWAAE